MSQLNSFQSCSFSHIGRKGNAVAHALAQRARFSFPLEVWTESVPPAISHFFLSDLQAYFLLIYYSSFSKKKKKIACIIYIYIYYSTYFLLKTSYSNVLI